MDRKDVIVGDLDRNTSDIYAKILRPGYVMSEKLSQGKSIAEDREGIFFELGREGIEQGVK